MFLFSPTAISETRRRTHCVGVGTDACARRTYQRGMCQVRAFVANKKYRGVRRRAEISPGAGLAVRSGNSDRHARSFDRPFGTGQHESETCHVSGHGRSGPDAGHGIQAPAAQDRVADPTRSTSAHVVRHLAA